MAISIFPSHRHDVHDLAKMKSTRPNVGNKDLGWCSYVRRMVTILTCLVDDDTDVLGYAKGRSARPNCGLEDWWESKQSVGHAKTTTPPPPKWPGSSSSPSHQSLSPPTPSHHLPSDQGEPRWCIFAEHFMYDQPSCIMGKCIYVQHFMLNTTIDQIEQLGLKSCVNSKQSFAGLDKSRNAGSFRVIFHGL